MPPTAWLASRWWRDVRFSSGVKDDGMKIALSESIVEVLLFPTPDPIQ
jgi:hypothetical protein